MYLDPAFTFPALKYLAQKHVILAVLYNTDNEDYSLVGLGLFEFCLGTFRFPLPHLVAYKSIHSFLSGLVIDPDKTEEVISSACNLISGNKAFAFKIGWDINYKKYSPGIINEIEFLQFADRKKLNFCQIESCATEDSYLNRYWSGRWLLAEGVFVFRARGEILVTGLEFIRRIIKSIVSLYESIKIPKK